MRQKAEGRGQYCKQKPQARQKVLKKADLFLLSFLWLMSHYYSSLITHYSLLIT
ncbi:MAG: hypothetical protein F6K47_39710 [Symploca sp. SIO2E6]|nr:hypothetical protein [Symploca sp. SIO2E6]